MKKEYISLTTYLGLVVEVPDMKFYIQLQVNLWQSHLVDGYFQQRKEWMK